tara:strand:+ start:1756 stop:2514 length:759 start_codon:yes stop_codon:yes gene_type:complete
MSYIVKLNKHTQGSRYDPEYGEEYNTDVCNNVHIVVPNLGQAMKQVVAFCETIGREELAGRLMDKTERCEMEGHDEWRFENHESCARLCAIYEILISKDIPYKHRIKEVMVDTQWDDLSKVGIYFNYENEEQLLAMKDELEEAWEKYVTIETTELPVANRGRMKECDITARYKTYSRWDSRTFMGSYTWWVSVIHIGESVSDTYPHQLEYEEYQGSEQQKKDDKAARLEREKKAEYELYMSESGVPVGEWYV